MYHISNMLIGQVVAYERGFLHSIFQADWVFFIILVGHNALEYDMHQVYYDRSIAHEYEQYVQCGPSYGASQSSAFQAANASTVSTIAPANSLYAFTGQPPKYESSADYPLTEWCYALPQEMAYAPGANLNI